MRAVAVRCLQLGPSHGYPPTPIPGKKTPYACIRALGRSGSEASLRALAQISHTTTSRRTLHELDKAPAEASARQSMPAAGMLEQLTPDHNLDHARQLSPGPA